MGTECRFVLDGDVDARALDAVLRAQPRFTDFDARYGAYNFRLEGAAPSMPHAEARLEERAVYFCDYADDGSIFEALRATLVDRFGVRVVEVE